MGTADLLNYYAEQRPRSATSGRTCDRQRPMVDARETCGAEGTAGEGEGEVTNRHYDPDDARYGKGRMASMSRGGWGSGTFSSRGSYRGGLSQEVCANVQVSCPSRRLATAEPDRRLAALRFTFPVDLLITNCQRARKSVDFRERDWTISLTIPSGGIQGFRLASIRQWVRL